MRMMTKKSSLFQSAIECIPSENPVYTHHLSPVFLGPTSYIQGGPKMALFLYALTSPNINRLSKLFYCQKQEKICNNTITKDPATPSMCCYTSCEMSSVLKAIIENKTSEVKRPTLIVTKFLINKQNFRTTLTKCQ